MAERNEDGTFKSRDDRDDDKQQRVEAVEVSDGSERDAFEESVEREGLTEAEGADRLTELMQEAGASDVDVPEGADPEVYESAVERLEEDGSIEAAVDALTEGIKGEEAAEAETADDGSEPIPFERLSEELGVSADDVMVTAKVQGEEQELPLSEAVRGYQRTKDYTRKTEELAAERREVESTGERYAQALEMIGVTLGDKLSPAQQKELVSEYQRVVGQVAEASRPDPAALEEERGKLKQQFGWDEDPEAWEEAKDNLARYATEDLGFSEEALASVHDHRLMTILEESRRYRQLKGEASELSDKARKGSTARKMKPGTTGSGKKSRDQGSDALQRLQRTGSVDDAAEVLEGLLGGE